MFTLALQGSRPVNAVPERGPKSSAVDFAIELQLPATTAFGNDGQMTSRGLKIEIGLKIVVYLLTEFSAG